MTLDYMTAAGYATVILGIIYALLETKRLGVTTFVIKVYTLIDYALVMMKISNTRQPFMVGVTHLEEDEAFRRLIQLKKYSPDYLAFFDKGQRISMRYLYDKRQVHVRVFDDGTITMHDEPNYDYDPMAHLRDAPQMPAPELVQEVLTALSGG